MYRQVSHRLHFAWGPSICTPICTPKGLLTTLTTRNFFISPFDGRFFNQLQKEHQTFKNKLSRAIGVPRMRLCKRFLPMKQAGDGTGGQYGGQAMQPKERTLKNKWSRAIGVPRVAHGKLRRGLRKRIRQMKLAGEGTE